ncbi:MAG TPA: hypothetical protein DD719_03845 [Desulfotomaculum sp.]|nr:hypothetical protein [Desulfotomaculum sp.]
MYNYEWDIETGGYILTTKVSGVTKELRPVFYEELDLLGFNEYWSYPKSEKPLLWAETRRYIHKGRHVAEAQGGGLYTRPTLKIYEENLELEQVNVEVMVKKNKALMTGLVQNTVGIIYNTFNEYKSKNIDVTYVAFSGGKDSIVLLDLVQRALPHNEFKVVFGDTTMEISDTYKAVERAKQRWSDLEFYTAKSHLDAKESWELFGPPSRTQRWCCSVHKSAPSLLKLKEITGKDKLKALVFDGIRAEESNARAKYAVVSEGQKHSTQSNCHPIFEWNTTELFIYMFDNSLFLNDAYRYGVGRVGCAICPMASSWKEFITNTVYKNDVNPLLSIIDKNIVNKISNKTEREKYLNNGGWKTRIDGRDLNVNGNKVMEQNDESGLTLYINNVNTNWKEWIKTIGSLIYEGGNNYKIEYRKDFYDFNVEKLANKLKVKISNALPTKEQIRFMYLFKNIFHKAAYCLNCKVCMVECPTGALQMKDGAVEIKNTCIKCERCLDRPKGCLVARSVLFITGGKNVKTKGLGNYKGFGFQKDWLEHFIKLGDNLWNTDTLGGPKYVALKIWLRESEITEKNSLTHLGIAIRKWGANDIKAWAIILNNLIYNSNIIKWYLQNTKLKITYSIEEISIMLGDDYSLSTKDNAIDSLKKTFRYSPIGTELGVGICELKGNSVVSITRTGWANPDPLVILYSLYKFAEKSDGYYSFTLSYLCDDSIERTGISPTQIFGLDRETMKDKLLSLATDYKDFISVSFNKDLDNIDLKKDKTSLDVLGLF